MKRRTRRTYVLHYDEPKSIGYIAPFYGNFGILVRAYAYMVSLGKEGCWATSNRAVLNANYLRERFVLCLEWKKQNGACMNLSFQASF